jgi:putative restriction endonuclease
LRDYYYRNKAKPDSSRRRLFFVVQAGRLQCLNGAYLSEVDEELAGLLFNSLPYDYELPDSNTAFSNIIRTDEDWRELKVRINQSAFSDAIRKNFGHQCCFPECDVSDDLFLIGAHIARWADAPELRGDIANGLCLCLMHDKAFEAGLFTLSLNYCVWLNQEQIDKSEWAKAHLSSAHGKPIRRGKVMPSENSISHHWERIRCAVTAGCLAR